MLMWIMSPSCFLLLDQDRKSLEAHEYCMIKDAKFATPLITLADSCCTPRVNKKFSVLFIERAGMRVLVILDSDWLQ